MDECIPSKVLAIKKSLPWFNADISQTIKKRDYYHHLCKSSFSEIIHRRYRSLRNTVVSALRKAKFTYLNSMSTLIRSSKDFWSVYHSLTPNRESLPHSLTNGSVSAVSPKSKANLLNSYFSSCFNTPSLSAPPLGSHSLSTHPTLSSVECTDEEVVNVLRSLKLKTLQALMVFPLLCSNIPSSLFPHPFAVCSICLCPLVLFQRTGKFQISLLSSRVETNVSSLIIDLSLFFPFPLNS